MYRSVVGGSKGVSVPASRLAKYKTLCQQLAVGFALLPLTALDATWLWNGVPVGRPSCSALVSGAQYLVGRGTRPEPCGDADAGCACMRCDVLAVGTELLLGQIVDTNSAWIGEQLAANGIASLACRSRSATTSGAIERRAAPRCSPRPTP